MIVPEPVVIVSGQSTTLVDQSVTGLTAQGVEVDGNERISAKFNAAFHDDPALLLEYHVRMGSMLLQSLL
jgi:hypothetical protein